MDDFQELVYARLQALPKDFNISVGDYGEISKDEALKHVEKNDDIGKVLIMIDREYFDMLKSGELYESLNQ